MRTLCAFLIALAVQGTTPQGPPASVEGVVVRFGSNEPVPGSLVELRRIQAGPVNPALQGLPPGVVLTNVPGAQPPASPLTTTTSDGGRFHSAVRQGLPPHARARAAAPGGVWTAQPVRRRDSSAD
jgi:hypothetical protein